jgi:hypothetical protein
VFRALAVREADLVFLGLVGFVGVGHLVAFLAWREL